MIYNLYSVICVQWGNMPTFYVHVDHLQPPLGPINAITVEFTARKPQKLLAFFHVTKNNSINNIMFL